MRSGKCVVVVGARRSVLAMTQARGVVVRLKRLFPQVKFIVKGIVTRGDRLTGAIAQDAKGVFVKEIEEALINRKIDLAVHSMKDLPIEIPKALTIAAVTKRSSPKDVLISNRDSTIKTLRPGARIGTSSPRRRVQLLSHRPDLKVMDIRGNLDTRIRKLKEGMYDAIIVAAAGMLRMGWQQRVNQFIPMSVMLPAPGQGALGIEIRKKDVLLRKIVKIADHRITRMEVKAERVFLKAMGGGCQKPIAAFGKLNADNLYLEAACADGQGRVVRGRVRGKSRRANELARQLAKRIKRKLLFIRQEGELRRVQI